jgi:hypothetical protein
MSQTQKPSRIRRGLIGLAWAVTLLALIYAFSAWHGRRAWNAYRASYEARVASLDFKSYVPKAIPDAENFAATPLVRSWFDPAGTNSIFGADHFGRVGPASEVSLLPVRIGDQPHFCDLVAWRDAFAEADKRAGPVTNQALSGRFDAASRAQAAPAVLAALRDDEALWRQLREASKRPDARYPLEYTLDDPWAIRLPHLAKIKGCCMRLELKACAELALNDTTNALADIQLTLRLADSLKDEGILISWLIRAVGIQAAIGAVWEGLAEHRWSEGQLEELQAWFEHQAFAPGLETCLHAERAAGVLTVDLIGRRDLPELSLFAQSTRPLAFMARFTPPSWRDQEKLQYCQLFDLQFQGAWDLAARRFSPGQVVSNSVALQDAISGSLRPVLRHRLMARLLLPPLGRTPFKAATAQAATDQAAIACALERYRLANGAFPTELRALTPKYIAALPNDVITGAPYQYQRTTDGSFTLASVGGEDKNVGGAADTELSNLFKRWFAVEKGDWSWSYPRE